MDALEYVTLFCPYCGEKNTLTVERTDSVQLYHEDCQVCCRAMLVEVSTFDDDIKASVRREDD